MLSAILLPGLAFVLPVWSVHLTTRLPRMLIEPVSPAIGMIQPTAGNIPTDRQAFSLSLDEGFVFVWVLGFGIAVLLLIVGGIRVSIVAGRASRMVEHRWMRISAEVSRALSLTRPVEILQSRDALLLAGWGLRRPRLLVPSDAENWGEARIRMVLCHEFAHVRRKDWAVQLFAEFVRAVYWFNPLVWITQAVAAGERACLRRRRSVHRNRRSRLRRRTTRARPKFKEPETGRRCVARNGAALHFRKESRRYDEPNDRSALRFAENRVCWFFSPQFV
jgi:beta-lactamase regulating signal transducer with metallopeptidase domain